VPLYTHIFRYDFQQFKNFIIHYYHCYFLSIDLLLCCEQYLAAGHLPNCLPSTLNTLRMLTLDVNLSSPEEASLTRLLLQNAPNLLKLSLVHLSLYSNLESLAFPSCLIPAYLE
jgi:hypothetical protein